MANGSLLDNDKFWQVIKYLLKIEKHIKVEQVCTELDLKHSDLISYINFLTQVDYKFELKEMDLEQYLIAPEDRPSIQIDFNLLEWIQFQAHFPAFTVMYGKPFHDDILTKFASIEDKYKSHDIFGPLELLEQVIIDNSQSMLMQDQKMTGYGLCQFLEESILSEKCVKLNMLNHSLMVYPRKILFLDGLLTLVAESLSDKCLLNIPLKEIYNIYEEDKEWKALFSKIEVEDFICGLRLIAGNEVRLVLKIHSYEKFDPRMKHQFLGSPCMITNPEGEVFWAATIEPSKQIFEWLENLGTDVEILDPTSFKKEFLKYCENKLKKIA